ncbi:MAG: hypothetical protein JXR37_15315 [Kiritimatiellae bacterium]|nr:hypothetical protein [Kiritimatiellia bacterium]
MTVRAVITGFVLAAFVAVGGHFNDVYMQQTYMVGNFFPISVMGTLVFIVLAVNPLLQRIRTRWRLRRAELAVIVALPLAVCVVPGSGFLRTFTPVLIMPNTYERQTPSWQKNGVLASVPDGLLVRPTEQDEEQVLGDFLQPRGPAQTRISPMDIPWRAWLPALVRWVPLFLALMLALIGLSLVLHRQWTTHEHLVYPVAEFVRLVTGSERAGEAPLMRTRTFWYALAGVLAVHLLNGLHAWFPSFIEFPHTVDLTDLRELFPTLASVPGSWGLFRATVYFSVVAFAYFLPSDITLSFGLANLAAALFGALLITYGVTFQWNWMGSGEKPGLMFGAYLGMALLILYTGRAAYTQTFLAALGLRKGTELERSAVWGCRVFLAMTLLGVLMMTALGLAWPFAVLAVLLLTLTFVCMSRICAESGLFFIQPTWQASAVFLGLLGAHALGPAMLSVVILICLVITIDPREAMMPFVINALRIGENAGLRRGRLALVMTGTLVVCLLAGLVTVLWLQYDRGVGLTDGWATKNVPTMGFALLDKEIQTLQADGTLESARTMSLGQRLLAIRPRKNFLAFVVIGFALFAACAFLRLRFSRWPLHPILFLVWGTYPINAFGTSFFIGWAVKGLVVRFGGARTYQRLKPLMVGIIAGDLLGGLIFMIAGALRYFYTGYPPPTYRIFPG